MKQIGADIDTGGIRRQSHNVHAAHVKTGIGEHVDDAVTGKEPQVSVVQNPEVGVIPASFHEHQPDDLVRDIGDRGGKASARVKKTPAVLQHLFGIDVMFKYIAESDVVESDALNSFTAQELLHGADENVAVSFNGSSSSDPEGPIAQYDWDFGDSNVANDAGPTPTNVYATDGKSIARLTVTDDSGETDTDITVVNVGIGNLPLEADAGGLLNGVVGTPIPFNGFGRDRDGDIVEFKWHFGDGSDSGPLAPAASKVAAATFLVIA